jgi:hypothetical protein
MRPGHSLQPGRGELAGFQEERSVNRFIVCSVIAAACVIAGPRMFAQQPVNDDKHLVYADFEKTDENKKPISARGGEVVLNPYQSQGSREATAEGPELVHVKKDDPNHLLKFNYALFAGAEWTGVTLEVRGQPDVDGKAVPDDVSGYKVLSFDCYATGVPILRVQILDKGHGAYNAIAPPEYTFKVKEGLNTYKVPLKAFSQPDWVKDERVDPKDVLKSLTSIHIIPFCENHCQENRQGMVIVDNIVFEK